MISKPIWTEETTVKGYDADFQGRWKPSSFFRLMSATAANHAEHIGFGFKTMFADGKAWVLSRMKVRFFEFPVISERLTIETWPKGFHRKLFFLRDFYVKGEGEKLYAAATSFWVLIDPQARRMLLPQQELVSTFRGYSDRRALDEDLEKINPPENLPEKFTLQARYSQIDIMGHVNNACYIDWITDCFEPEEYRTKRLAWLQINYNNEVRPSDAITVSAGKVDGDPLRWVAQGTNLTTGTQAFEAALGWTKR